jgi:hypothetical protein
MSGVSGTLFGNTASEYSGGVPCSITITPEIEQYILLGATTGIGGTAGLTLTTERGGQSGNGSGGVLSFDFFADRVPPELSYCDAGINIGTPGSALSDYPQPWSPGTTTSIWPSTGVTGSFDITWNYSSTPSQCGGTSISAANTALAVASSGAECPTILLMNDTPAAYAGGDLEYTATVTGSASAPPTGEVKWTVTAPGNPPASVPCTPNPGGVYTLGDVFYYTCAVKGVIAGTYQLVATYEPDQASPYKSGNATSNATVDPVPPDPQFSSAESDTLRFASWCTTQTGGSAQPTGLPSISQAVKFLYCSWHGLAAISDENASNDPPDLSFRAVFQPKPFTAPRLGSCPRLRGSSCRRLRTAEVQYLDALARVASLSEAVGVTANRFGGAKDAGDLHAEWLQGVAESKYLPLQASAASALQQAGRRLGTLLRTDHLNTALTAKQVAQGRNQLAKLDGIPQSLIARLESDGLITSRNDLKQIIAALLKKAPRARGTTLAQLLET